MGKGTDQAFRTSTTSDVSNRSMEEYSIQELREQLRVEKEARQREQQARQREQQRADKAEQQTRASTLPEYIENCHECLYRNFTVETDKSLTSKGSITNPQNKWLPSHLLPWRDFLGGQKSIFRRLQSTFSDDIRAFESLSVLRGLGDRVGRRRVANERDLEHVQHLIVEDPVSSIIAELAKEDAVQDRFGIGNGIVFDNHVNALSDIAEEPLERRAGPNMNQLRADQVCVYRYDPADASRRSLAFVVEYKAPHKLTLPHLRLGLREMDIEAEVVNRATKPTADDATALFQYHADRLAAAAVTQTYHYMVEGGLEYSYLTTGEAFVFFKIDWNNPETLLFHLAEPRAEVEAHPDDARYCTAVSQVLAFTLLVMGAQTRGQSERRQAMDRLSTWAEDYEAILHCMPASERKQTPPSSAFEPKTYSTFVRSPHPIRSRMAAASTCRPACSHSGRRKSPDLSDDDSMERPPESPSLRRTDHLQRRQHGIRGVQVDTHQGSTSHSQNRQYCTQQCLVGLVRGGALDQRCPNVQLHDPCRNSHPLDHVKWELLLQKQLARSLDDGVTPLWKQGARGVAFQVTLLAYGYTFFGKGTVPEFVSDLRREASIYRQLEPLQGRSVPVYLTTVGLDPPHYYYYDHRVRLVHFIFLSWAGEPIPADGCLPISLEDVEQQLVRQTQKLHVFGVVHGDMRRQNVLWCEETSGLMLIDFERAVMLDAGLPLAETAQNRRPSNDVWCRGQTKSARDGHRFGPSVLLKGRVQRSPRKLTKKGTYNVAYSHGSLANSRYKQNRLLGTAAAGSLQEQDILAAKTAFRV